MLSKAVILAAGSASRMQKNIERYISNREELSAVKKGEKMAASFGNYPFLDYQILNLIQAGLREINLVLNPEDTFFTNHYNKNGKILFPEAVISYSFQKIPDGTAHAVLVAERFINGDRFVVLNGDNNYSARSIQMLLNTQEKYSSMVAFDTVGFNESTREKLKAFAVVETEDGKLREIVEKAQNPGKYITRDLLYTINNDRLRVNNSIMTSMNLWCFAPAMMYACRDVGRHEPRKEGKPGEFELPDAVKLWMQQGGEILVYYACADVLDLTMAEDVKIVGSNIRKNLMDKMLELEKRYARL